MFSNATEAQIWQERNCYRCWKYSPKAVFPKDARCRAAFWIDRGYVTGEFSKRVGKITENTDCPLRQEKRPACKKKPDSAMPLFEQAEVNDE